MPAHNRVYLADKDMHLYSYSLSLHVVEYQTAVLRGDMDTAAEILPEIPKDQVNKVARFLESKGGDTQLLQYNRLLKLVVLLRLEGARTGNNHGFGPQIRSRTATR